LGEVGDEYRDLETISDNDILKLDKII